MDELIHQSLKAPNKKSDPEVKGAFYLLASSLAFSLMSVCVKHLGGRIPIAEIVLARSLISLLITGVMLQRLAISPWGRRKKALLTRGFLGTSALFCVFEAIKRLPLAAATVIQYTYPTFIAIGAWILLGERIKYRIALAVFLGWSGIALVAKPEWIKGNTEPLPILAIAIALSGALLTALAYILVRNLSKTEHSLVIIFYFPFVSVPITLPIVLNNAVLPNETEWLWIIGVGIFTQVGQICITKGLSLLPAAKAGSLNYAQVFFASIWGIILFSEFLDIWDLIGSAFVLAATVISLSTNNIESNKPLAIQSKTK